MTTKDYSKIYADKNKAAIDECIAEAERYIRRCKKYRATIGNSSWAYPSMEHAAVLRAGLDLRRIMSRFARRWTNGNYEKTWSECE